MRRIALYLVITGNYDTPIEIPEKFRQGIDCFLFTDDDTLSLPGFQTIKFDPTDRPHITQRVTKICIPARLSEYDVVIYLDANVQVLRPITDYLRYHKGDVSVKIHPKRNCVYQEGFACIEKNKANPEDIKAQLKNYIDRGIKPCSGMYETNVLIRSKSDQVNDFCEAWAKELGEGTHRDQLSIIPAIESTGIKINAIPYSIYQQHFKTHPHRPKKEFKIHYIQPYSTEKNIGLAINEAIRCLNAAPEDWIVLNDYDAIYCSPNYGRHIEACIRKYGKEYVLLGSMTNRIRADHQKVPGMFEEMDMRKHFKVGKDLEDKHWAEVKPCTGVAGFCMAFPKSAWDKIKFQEDDIKFDTHFSQAVSKLGKIGVMQGVYMFHAYRLWSSDPLNETNHLK